MVQNYNEAVAILAEERAEAEMIYAEEQAKLADQPKFDVFAMDGSRLLGGIPESMIRPSESVTAVGESAIALPTAPEKADPLADIILP
jgi:hypothetical protein